MEKLGMPLRVNAIYILLLGLVTLSPAAVRTVFGYEIKDTGVLLVLSATLLGLGVVLWGIAGDPAKHAELAISVIIALVIAIAFLLWGWINGLFTPRNVVLPLVIDIVLGAWIWSARTRT